MTPAFWKVLCSSLSGRARAFPGMILWDQVSDGAGGNRRSDYTSGCCAGMMSGRDISRAPVFSLQKQLPQGLGTFVAQSLCKAMATFTSRLWQEVHEFIPAKLTCNKRHRVVWKKKPPRQERWESLVPGPQTPHSETGAGAASLVS